MRPNQIITLLLMAVVLAGCASDGHRAPVYERAEAEKSAALAKKSKREKDWRPESYVVQKGDTLYSIAFNYGFDYHELAELNGIKDPRVISIGQEIRLFPDRSLSTPRANETVETKPREPLAKDQPKLVKYAYSEAALAQIEKVQEPNKPNAISVAKLETKSEPVEETGAAADDAEEAAIVWGMPARGKLIGQFSESANRKGIDIAGKLGQPVVASAAGQGGV